MIATYFKTKPFEHQAEEFEISRDLESRGYWWEPGCAKTKPTIDTAAYLFDTGKATGMLVLAPGGVHEQWVKDQIPMHMCDHILDRTSCFVWHTKKSGTKKFQESYKQFEARGDFHVLSMTYSAIMTQKGAKAAKKFMKDYDTILVLDESHNIKSPGAKRTIRILAAGKHAVYRRALSGTPVDDKPFDTYTQTKFLDPNLWVDLGISSFAAFKATFGVWKKRKVNEGRPDERVFPELVTYRNLHKLKELLLKTGSRLQLKDVWDDMPEQLYEKVYFDLSSSQRRMYEELGSDLMTTLDDGSFVTAALAITRQVRQQQITSGYLPADDESLLRPIEAKNPRIQVLRDTMDRLPGPAIIWGKYDIDIDCIAGAAKNDGYSFVTYDGRTPEDQRQAAVEAFSKGDAQFFIGKPSAAGTGTDGLQRSANIAVWYNNGFRLNHRIQGEGRLLRFGQNEGTVLNIDIVARDTIDELILHALRTKRCLASEVQGDNVPSWI